jgi:uncharacterized membrane protein YcaP (DUF421 family)
MTAFYHSLDRVFGINVEPGDLSVLQMSARALVVFVSSLFMFRLAHKRFFAQRNALDVLMTLVIASVLARAINGSAAFFPTIVVGFLLVIVHRVLTRWSAHSKHIAQLVKGHTSVLIENGVVYEDVLRRHFLSREDLEEDLRIRGIASPDQVRRATLERNGEVSVIERGSA